MFNADENKETARVMIEKYFSNLYHRDFFLSKEDFNTLLEIVTDPKKGKVPATKFLRNLFIDIPAPWSPSGYANNQFERFVQDQESKPIQTLDYLISLKEAKDIVDWLVAQERWFSF